MGLLNNPNLSGLAQGLLAASGPSTTPVGFGQALAMGMQSRQQQQELQRKREIEALKMQQLQQQMAAAQQQREAQQALSQGISQGNMARPEMASLLAQMGQPVAALGFLEPKQPDLPSGMWQNPQTGQIEYMPAYIEGQRMLRAAGAPQTTVNNNIGPNTPGREQADKTYAKDFVTWTTSGFADTQKNLGQLDAQLQKLQSGKVETGPIAGRVPDAMKAFINPGLLDLRESVEEVVQRNLREILGAQFTEKEGERLIQRAFNENLPTPVNIQRLKRLTQQIRSAAKAKQEAAAYFNQHGTLQGFKGKTYSKADFDPDSLFGEDTPNAGGWSIKVVQ